LNFGIFAKLLNPIIIKKIAAKRMRNDPIAELSTLLILFYQYKGTSQTKAEQPSKPISTALTP
jgi:hypothetical protein